jgi:hypothetical protein
MKGGHYEKILDGVCGLRSGSHFFDRDILGGPYGDEAW